MVETRRSDQKRWVSNTNAHASISSQRKMQHCHFLIMLHIISWHSWVFTCVIMQLYSDLLISFSLPHCIYLSLTPTAAKVSRTTPSHPPGVYPPVQWPPVRRDDPSSRHFYLLYPCHHLLWESTDSHRSSFNPKLIMATACAETYH